MSLNDKEILDNNIIYFDENNVKALGINPKDLYCMYKCEERINGKGIKGGNTETKDIINFGITTDMLRNAKVKLSTNSRILSGENTRKIIEFINNYSNMGIHIPIIYEGMNYYIEFTAKEGKKMIIAVNKDRRHRAEYELIHISLYPKSYVHITFINNLNHYKIYNIEIPENKKLMYILKFVILAFAIFDGRILKREEFWNHSSSNNWKNDIINNPVIIREFQDNLSILLYSMKYLIANYHLIFVPP